MGNATLRACNMEDGLGYRELATAPPPGRLLHGAVLASFFWLPLTLYLSGWWPLGAPGASEALVGRQLNDRPVIAILASDCASLYNCSSYIPASYVRWLQQGGSRVVPLHSQMDDVEFEHVLSHVNGALMVGGFFKMNGTAEPRVRKIWEHAVSLADAGEVFPVWATCVGIHDLIQLATGEVYASFLEQTYADNVALPLSFSATASPLLFDEARLPGSAMFQRWMEDDAVTYHHHEWGVTPQTFRSFEVLEDTFEIVATASDKRGGEFVALMQGRTQAIFASAFHPEKPAFEWGMHRTGMLRNTEIPHTREAILANLHLGAAFVDQARHSLRHFSTEAELLRRLVFNSRLVYTAPVPDLIRYFEECYIYD